MSTAGTPLREPGDWVQDMIAVATRRDRDGFMRIYDHFMPRLCLYLRGMGTPEAVAEELSQAGAPAEMVVSVETELEAAEAALEWAQEGDLLLLLTHEERARVLDLLRGLKARRWRPGQSVTAASAAPASS